MNKYIVLFVILLIITLLFFYGSLNGNQNIPEYVDQIEHKKTVT